MRTTLEIDEDVMRITQEIAERDGVSVGKVVSQLVRLALNNQPKVMTRNGIPLFPLRVEAGSATLEIVNQLRDEGA